MVVFGIGIRHPCQNLNRLRPIVAHKNVTLLMVVAVKFRTPTGMESRKERTGRNTTYINFRRRHPSLVPLVIGTGSMRGVIPLIWISYRDHVFR